MIPSSLEALEFVLHVFVCDEPRIVMQTRAVNCLTRARSIWVPYEGLQSDY